MKKLAVFDLDHTLITCDSFRILIQSQMKPALLPWILLRFLRLISKKTFAEKMYSGLKGLLENDSFTTGFCNRILRDKLQADVFDKFKSIAARRDTELVILSASPSPYIKKIGEALGCQAFGSHYVGTHFVHLHGQGKVEFLKKNFPSQDYIYYYSISDSESDRKLLELFDKYDLISPV